MNVCRQLSSVARTLILVMCLGDCLQGLAATDSFLTLSQPVVTNGQVQFTLTGEPDEDYVIESSGDTQNWSPVTTNSEPGFTRLISLPVTGSNAIYRASRPALPIFGAAIVTRSNLNLRGPRIVVNSFDSADPNHDDPLDPSEVKAGGDIACDQGLASLTNSIINGKLRLGPTALYGLGTNGSVGDLAWMGPGVQPGWYEDDFRFVFPDVVPPFTNGVPPVEIPLSTNRWQLSGDYYVSGDVDFNTGKNILVTGYARLFVAGDFIMHGTAAIWILPGASLKLYVGGPQAVLTQVNTAGDALSFSYFGLPTNTSINWQGNAEYKGTVYAPQAVVNLGGGGKDVHDFQSACVAHSVVLNGHLKFHFDEHLKRVGPMR